MTRNRAIACTCLTVLAVVCTAALGAQRQAVEDKALAFLTVVDELGSPDPAVRQAAQDQLLALGPEKIEHLRRISGFLQEVVTMQDKLVAKPSSEMNDAEVHRNAREAIQYFSSRGAVRYLGLGLGSQVADGDTARALARLDQRIKEKQAKAIVSVIASFLEGQRPVTGSEIATIQQIIIETLCEPLCEAAGMGPEGADKEVLKEEARAALRKVLERFHADRRAGAAAKKALETLEKAPPGPRIPQDADAQPAPEAAAQPKPN